MSQQNPTIKEATAYAESFILHGDMSKAFRAAFPKSTASSKSINEKASKLHKLTKIQSRIEELREITKKQSEDEFSLSVGRIKQMLALAASKGLKDKIDAQGNKVPVSIPGAVSALSEISKIDGNHAAIRLALGGDPDAPPISVDNVPDDPLEAAKAYQKMLEG